MDSGVGGSGRDESSRTSTEFGDLGVVSPVSSRSLNTILIRFTGVQGCDGILILSNTGFSVRLMAFEGRARRGTHLRGGTEAREIEICEKSPNIGSSALIIL